MSGSQVPFSRFSLCRALATLLLTTVTATSLAAQQTPSSLRGIVIDSQSAPVSGATITVAPSGTSVQSRQTVTGEDGRFEFSMLADGSYTLEVSHADFPTATLVGVAADGEPVEITMQAAAGQRAPASRISEAQLAGLPLNGRSYNQLATLQAGIADTSSQDSSRGIGGGNLTVAGGRPSSNNFLMDGTNIMDTSNQVPRSAGGVQLGSEAVFQVQVFSTVVSSEYGRGSGGTLNSITRSGSNDFHGTVFEYFRNSKLDARNFFDQSAEPPPFKRNQFGFILTGPIRRDNTFFMATYEAMRDRLTETETTVLPDAQARQGIITDCSGNILRTVPVNPRVAPYLDLYPMPNLGCIGGGRAGHAASVFQPTNDSFFSARIDHRISETDSLFGRYSFDDAASIGAQELFRFRTDTQTRQQYLTLVETHIFDVATLNSFRFGYTRPSEAIDTLTDPEIPRDLFFVPDAPHFGQIRIPGFTNFGPSHVLPEGNNLRTFQFANNVVMQRGSHSIKVGAQLHRYAWDIFNSNSKGGIWEFNSLDSFLLGGPDGTGLGVVLPGNDNSKGYRQTLFAAYIQNGYQATANLHLELGLRYEFGSIVSEATGKTFFLRDWLNDPSVELGPMLGENPSLFNFSPRIGFSWAPGGNDSLLVSGGFGIYSDPLLEHVIEPQKNSAPFNERVILPSFDATPFFPDAVAAARASTFGTPSATSVLDYQHITLPQVYRYTLSLQRTLPRGANLRAAYVGARGNHLFRGYEANLYPQWEILPDGSFFFPSSLVPLNPSFGSIGITTSDAQSFYNALQLTAGFSPVSDFSIQGNYTFSKSIDDATIASSGSSNNFTRQFPYARTLDRGYSDYDIRHRLSVNYFYSLPFGRGRAWLRNGVLERIFGNWHIGGVLSARSGTPFIPRVTVRSSQTLFAANRPNQAPTGTNNPTSGVTAGCGLTGETGVPAGEPLGGPDRFFDPCAFEAPPLGTLGNVARNAIIGPSLFNMDLSLQKDILLGGDRRLQFRAEFFNIPNHANFSNPSSSSAIVYSGSTARVNQTAGKLFNTSTTNRQIQLALRLSF